VSLRDAEERVPRSAVLRSASHRVARNDGAAGVAPSGSWMVYPRSRGHVLATHGARSSSHGHALRGHATQRKPHAHGQDEQHAGAGQATENHRDHRVDLAHPDCLCALCVLCGKPHAPRGTAHPTVLQAPTAVIPTGGPKARSGGTRSNSPSARHPTRSRSNSLPWGVNVDLTTKRSTP